MKKITLLAGLLLSSGIIGAQVANAATDSATSNGTVKLESDPTQATPPTNPDRPNDPGTGHKGDLTVDDIPDFNFVGKGLKGEFKDDMSSITANFPNYVRTTQVTNGRGKSVDWALDLTIKPFINSTDNTVLKGATISMSSALATNSNTSIAPDVAKPSVTDVLPDSASNSLVIPLLQASAAKDQGRGTWNINFANAKLDIKDGNKSGTYTSEFVWSLTDAPTGQTPTNP